DDRSTFENRRHHRVTRPKRRLNTTAHQTLDCCSAGADVDEINVQSLSLKGTNLFSHPDPGHARADGGIGHADFLFGGLSGLDRKWQNKSEREDTTDNTENIQHPSVIFPPPRRGRTKEGV